MVAVMLLLAILPSAAAVSSPGSVAILDFTLGAARASHVQRERPNPMSGNPVRLTWGSLFGKVSPASGRGLTVSKGLEPLPVLGRLWRAPERRDGLCVMVRCGTVCLPPPVTA